MGDSRCRTVQQAQISTEAARVAAAAAVEEAHRLCIRINVAVVDAAGVPMAFLRMNQAPLHSISLAEDKAYTAASFGAATSAWPELLKAFSPAVQKAIPQRPRFTGFGGGLPVRDQNQLVGGIGVSGGSEEQDEQCARAGLLAAGFES